MPHLLSSPTQIFIEYQDLQRWERRSPKKKVVRTPGWHLSGIHRHVLLKTGLLGKWAGAKGQGQDTAQDPEEEDVLMMALGLAWENWIVGLWPNVDWQPGERHRDEVYCSMDGLDHKAKVIHEFKLTWKSERHYQGKGILDHTPYMWQLMGECAIAGYRNTLLHVCWVCGDYRAGSPKPRYITYPIGFEDGEVERHWKNIVLKNRNFVEKEG